MRRIKAFGIKIVRSLPWLHRLIWHARQSYWKIQRKILLHRPMVDVSALLAEAITHSKPFCAGKMGSVELRGLRAYLKRERAKKNHKAPPPYPATTAETLFINAGVFPKNAEAFDAFSARFIIAVSQFDALGVWDVAGEAQVISSFCPNTRLFELATLEPFHSERPWSAALAGKRVLVISPFANTVRQQYEKRETLWDDKRILPAFSLLTIRAPLSAGIAPPPFPTWTATIENLIKQMDSLDYDVVLIGAGAFSLPLAAHAKNRGKIGIHLGGGLQILFGIMGKRWEQREDFAAYIKPSWTRPSGEEKPRDAGKIENACYW